MIYFIGQDRSYLSGFSRPEGLLRIVCVGDSMTYGQGALPDQTFPFQLEQVLNAALWERQVEVINGGVCGYSIHDAWGRYLDRFARCQPDLVIVTVCDNDAELFNHREAVEEHIQRLSYLEFSELCYDPAGEHFPYFRLLLREMARHTAAGGPPVVVAFYDIHGGDHRDLLMPRVRDACCDAGVPFADLSQDFLDSASANRKPQLKVSDTDHHPSPLAHGFAARRLARCLFEAGLVRRGTGKPPAEAAVVGECVARTEAIIRDGGAADTALYLLKRTLIAKRDSRARLDLAVDALMSEADYRDALDILNHTWSRSVQLSVWEAYYDSLKEWVQQFDFGLRLFDLAHWRFIKSLFVLEQRLADASLPVVGQFQLARSPQSPLLPGRPEPADMERLLTRIAVWQSKLDTALQYAMRCFGSAAEAGEDVATPLQPVRHSLSSRLKVLESQVKPLWNEATRMVAVAGAHVRRFEAVAERSRHVARADLLPELSRGWGLLEELAGQLDFCLTAAQFDTLNLLSRSSAQPVSPGLTLVQVQVTAPRPAAGMTNGEPLYLEIQVLPRGAYARPTADIHNLVRDGTPRIYEFAVPFLVMGELRVGVEHGREVQLGTVRLSTSANRIVSLEPHRFALENDGHVYCARVLVPA